MLNFDGTTVEIKWPWQNDLLIHNRGETHPTISVSSLCTTGRHNQCDLSVSWLHGELLTSERQKQICKSLMMWRWCETWRCLAREAVRFQAERAGSESDTRTEWVTAECRDAKLHKGCLFNQQCFMYVVSFSSAHSVFNLHTVYWSATEC